MKPHRGHFLFPARGVAAGHLEGLVMRDPGTFLLFLFFSLLFWLAMRPVVCWYWRIKEVVQLLDGIKQRSVAASNDSKAILNVLRSIDARLAALQGDAGDAGEAGGAAGKAPAGAGGQTPVQGLSQAIGKAAHGPGCRAPGNEKPPAAVNGRGWLVGRRGKRRRRGFPGMIVHHERRMS